MIAFRLNGQATTYDGDPAVSLLSYLRNDRHLTAAKDGCSGQAACGACLVELNGKACLACSTPMSKVTDGDVVTLEGLPETLRRTLGMAFVNRGAVQCGFCTPGFLMRAKVLLQTNPNPTREEVVKAVRPHLCRCTGYVKLVDAILDAATLLPEGTFPNPTTTRASDRAGPSMAATNGLSEPAPSSTTLTRPAWRTEPSSSASIPAPACLPSIRMKRRTCPASSAS
ncbi:MAG: (2Fe-2S)-binding protein [Bilophila wadsworthia]